MRPFHIDNHATTIWWSAKSGCSTIKNCIHKYILQAQPSDIHTKTWNVDFKKLHYKNILIVRDPITRCIACYLDKYEWWKKSIFQRDYSFLEFLDQIISLTPDFEHHVARQFEEEFSSIELTYMLQYKRRFRFDHVYKLEEIHFPTFLQQHFGITLENIDLLHVSKKNADYIVDKAHQIPKPYLLNDKGELPNYSCFLTSEIINKIKQLYQKDYDYMKMYGIIY